MCHAPNYFVKVFKAIKKLQLLLGRLKRRKLELFTANIILKPEEATELDNQQREELNGVLLKYQDIFKEEGPPTPYAEHRIDTKEHPAIASAPYRMNTSRQVILKEKLDNMKNIFQQNRSDIY
ncbi:hypothetical protein NQ315_011296 [Exocentrus adspersus]|uniref:Uncharacterized protein n=1 Tax=Exocentrus adspersus TaxID=1586481 RepID=A0AAV8VJF5_9CUCU|nr:hypothetical protein NQ315_011296 [Exocentrus adspersus]